MKNKIPALSLLLVGFFGCGPKGINQVNAPKDAAPLQITAVDLQVPSPLSRRVKNPVGHYKTLFKAAPTSVVWFMWPTAEDFARREKDFPEQVFYPKTNIPYIDKLQVVSAMVAQNSLEFNRISNEFFDIEEERNKAILKGSNLENEIKSEGQEYLKKYSCENSQTLSEIKMKEADGKNYLILNLSYVSSTGILRVSSNQVCLDGMKAEQLVCKEAKYNDLLQESMKSKATRLLKKLKDENVAGYDSYYSFDLGGKKYLCPHVSAGAYTEAHQHLENFPFSLPAKSDIPASCDEVNEGVRENCVADRQHFEESVKDKKEQLTKINTDLSGRLADAYKAGQDKYNEKLNAILSKIDIDARRQGIVVKEDYKNYIKVEPEKSAIDFNGCQAEKVPYVKLVITQFLTKENQDHEVSYESKGRSDSHGVCKKDLPDANEKGEVVTSNIDTEDPRITDVQYYIEFNTPILKFKLAEIRTVGVYETVDGVEKLKKFVEERTGRYFVLELKQNKTAFGHEFIGDVTYKEANGAVINTGMGKFMYSKNRDVDLSSFAL
jgi:hypothetical protein